MADLSTKGSFPSDWRVKAYNGGVKFINGDTIMARITPCLENGKTAFVNFLEDGKTGFGSTEYIAMATKGDLPPEYFYFLARNREFVAYAIAHMNGSSGRQRVSGADIEKYEVRFPSEKQLAEFKLVAASAMQAILANSLESRKLAALRDALLPKLMSGEIDVSKVDLTQLNSHLEEFAGRLEFSHYCCRHLIVERPYLEWKDATWRRTMLSPVIVAAPACRRYRRMGYGIHIHRCSCLQGCPS